MRAFVKRHGEIYEVPIGEVHTGDIVVIRPAAELAHYLMYFESIMLEPVY